MGTFGEIWWLTDVKEKVGPEALFEFISRNSFAEGVVGLSWGMVHQHL